ncbi:MAG: hypothetical protein F4X08_05675 [Gemmatimonadetes bacterium]|nr:hypothetical protein [Gemmatimonadota bacterium]MYD25282.1 hypothetical protein [Gemmatimonadota bacterium]MYI98950.1 hypothetical protein [Gemmatimonadota bacterium]
MRSKFALAMLILAVLAAKSCGNEAPDLSELPETNREDMKNSVVTALDVLVTELGENRPADSAEYAGRLRAYLDANPDFYGSAVALLDKDGTVTACPYVFRTENGYNTIDLATSSYNLEQQHWFMVPLQTNMGIWTDPYYDAGGGEIWMITRSVPMHDDGDVIAILTTDLQVDTPERNDP